MVVPVLDATVPLASGTAAPLVSGTTAPLALRRVPLAVWPAAGTFGDGTSLLGAFGYGDADDGFPPEVDTVGMRTLDAPPSGRLPRIDAWVTPGPVIEGRTGAVRWRDGGAWLYGALALDDGGTDGIEALARHAYGDVFRSLDARGAPALLRLWNYLPRIHDDDDALERYRRFNLGRAQAFRDAGRDLHEGAPAACALGTPGGPLRVMFLAGRAAAPVAVENPRQVSAYRYPAAYGPASPTFSRAALADAGDGRAALFVSGTASIVGHASAHPGDVAAQARETLANLTAVTAAARARSTAAFDLSSLRLVVYLRHAADLPVVRGVLAAALGAGSPSVGDAVWLQADICRRELLVEIEAHAQRPGEVLP